jgi:hypothetical protein
MRITAAKIQPIQLAMDFIPARKDFRASVFSLAGVIVADPTIPAGEPPCAGGGAGALAMCYFPFF